MFADLFTEVLQAINRNRLRAAATGFAVTSGIFLLIVLLAFWQDGELSQREIFVMIAILTALSLTNDSDDSDTDDSRNCFCNR